MAQFSNTAVALHRRSFLWGHWTERIFRLLCCQGLDLRRIFNLVEVGQEWFSFLLLLGWDVWLAIFFTSIFNISKAIIETRLHSTLLQLLLDHSRVFWHVLLHFVNWFDSLSGFNIILIWLELWLYDLVGILKGLFEFLLLHVHLFQFTDKIWLIGTSPLTHVLLIASFVLSIIFLFRSCRWFFGRKYIVKLVLYLLWWLVVIDLHFW